MLHVQLCKETNPCCRWRHSKIYEWYLIICHFYRTQQWGNMWWRLDRTGFRWQLNTSHIYNNNDGNKGLIGCINLAYMYYIDRILYELSFNYLFLQMVQGIVIMDCFIKGFTHMATSVRSFLPYPITIIQNTNVVKDCLEIILSLWSLDYDYNFYTSLNDT